MKYTTSNKLDSLHSLSPASKPVRDGTGGQNHPLLEPCSRFSLTLAFISLFGHTPVSCELGDSKHILVIKLRYLKLFLLFLKAFNELLEIKSEANSLIQALQFSWR